MDNPNVISASNTTLSDVLVALINATAVAAVGLAALELFLG